MPLTPLVWGSILDDVWAIFTDEPSDDNLVARNWLPDVATAWRDIGVENNATKEFDAAEFCEI